MWCMTHFRSSYIADAVVGVGVGAVRPIVQWHCRKNIGRQWSHENGNHRVEDKKMPDMLSWIESTMYIYVNIGKIYLLCGF